VFHLPLLLRHPQGLGAGTVCDAFVQAHDLAPTMLEAAGVRAPQPLDGRSVFRTAFHGAPPIRENVTVGWGASFTVIDDHWWFNAKVDGAGALLYPVGRALDQSSVADDHPDLVRRLFATGKADAGGSFPAYLFERAAALPDMPGSASFNAAA